MTNNGNSSDKIYYYEYHDEYKDIEDIEERTKKAKEDTLNNFKYTSLYDTETTLELSNILLDSNCEIINVGMMPDIEGGLCIEYIKNNDKYRFVLGYTELGDWVEFHKNIGSIKEESKDISKF